MKIITVIPLKRGLTTEQLTYFSAQEIALGSLVAVPIRKKTVDALVVDSRDLAESKSIVKNASFGLKKISAVRGALYLSKPFLATVSKIKDYTGSNTAETLTVLLPKIFLESNEKLLPPSEPDIIIKSNLRQEKLVLQNATEERLDYYKTFIRESFAKKKSVFLCLPGRRDIEFFAERLNKGIESYVTIFHGEISKKDFVRRYNQLAKSEHPILILATPQYLFLTPRNLSAIILEKESGPGYRTLARPYLDLRLFAELLAGELNLKIILADTLLRAETLERIWGQELSEVLPISFRPRRVNRQLIDLSASKSKDFKAISPELRQLLEEAPGRDRTFLFALRKGLAPITVCNDCQKTLLCDHCEAPLVLYQSETKKRVYLCHRCRWRRDALVKCKNCDSWNLAALGVGGDLIEKEIALNWPKRPIFRFDKDKIKSEKEANQTISAFYRTPGAILIGTELTLRYLSEPIENTAIVSFDSLFSIPDFRISEKIMHLLTDINNLATKNFAIQTKNPADQSLQYFCSGNVAQFYRDELANRQKFDYPPYATLIKISRHGSRQDVLKSEMEIEKIFADYQPLVYRAFIPKIKDTYVLNALLKIKKEKGRPLDPKLLSKIRSLPPYYTVVVDPEDTL